MSAFPYPISQGDTRGHSSGLGHALDLATPIGIPVTAPMEGDLLWRVTRSEDLGADSYGEWVEVASGGIRCRYAHLDERLVQVGDRLDGGVLLGYTGNSGGSTGPHLHFEASDDIRFWAKRIWEVISVLTRQDKQWIIEQVQKQNEDLLNALAVGRLRGRAVKDNAVDTVRQRVKNNNLKALHG